MPDQKGGEFNLNRLFHFGTLVLPKCQQIYHIYHELILYVVFDIGNKYFYKYLYL